MYGESIGIIENEANNDLCMCMMITVIHVGYCHSRERWLPLSHGQQLPSSGEWWPSLGRLPSSMLWTTATFTMVANSHICNVSGTQPSRSFSSFHRFVVHFVFYASENVIQISVNICPWAAVRAFWPLLHKCCVLWPANLYSSPCLLVEMIFFCIFLQKEGKSDLQRA